MIIRTGMRFGFERVPSVPRIASCAARAALDLTGSTIMKADTCKPSHPYAEAGRVMAARRMTGFVQWCTDRAPPARRIASCARSYSLFGPVIPAPFVHAPVTGVTGQKT